MRENRGCCVLLKAFPWQGKVPPQRAADEVEAAPQHLSACFSVPNKKFYSIFFKKSRIPKAEPLGRQNKAAPDRCPKRPIFISSSANQYALPQYTITLAGLPQQGHTSPICSCSKGMQRLDSPATSFIFSSQASSPHHIVLI